MADIGQATFTGGNIIILCDSKWTCCQRQQAQYKVKAMNKRLPKFIREAVTDEMSDIKEQVQADERDAMDAHESADDRADAAEKAGAAPCVVDELRKGKSRSQMKLQMDHPLDVKLGGAARTKLIPLDAKINRFFGGVAKNAGDQMREDGNKKLESVSLVCPAEPPCKKPHEDGVGKSYDQGKKKEYPEEPEWVTPKRAME